MFHSSKTIATPLIIARTRCWPQRPLDVTPRRHYSVLFFGSDAFAVPFLDRLVRGSSSSAASASSHVEVVVPPDGRGGRGRKDVYPSAVKKFALERGLVVHEAPPKTVDRPMTQFNVPVPCVPGATAFDVGVVVSFPYFLTENIVAPFTKGLFNFHPSLLPKYRGAAPIQHTILNGDTETGMTLIDISLENWDCGKILLQRRTAVDPRADFASLSAHFQQHGPEMVLEVLDRFDHYWTGRQTQDPAPSAPKANKIVSSVGNVSLHRDTAQRLDRVQRAIGHQYPIRITSRGKPLALFDVRLPSQPYASPAVTSLKPGMAILSMDHSELIVRCADSIVTVRSLQRPMRSVVTPHAFVLGLQVRPNRPFVLEEEPSSASSRL